MAVNKLLMVLGISLAILVFAVLILSAAGVNLSYLAMYIGLILNKTIGAFLMGFFVFVGVFCAAKLLGPIKLFETDK